MLTEKYLKSVKSIDGSELLLSDSAHLKLRVYKTSSGSLTFTWLYRYKIKSKVYKQRIGIYPDMTLTEARAICVELDAKLLETNEPLQPTIQRNIRKPNCNSVKSLFEQYIDFKRYAVRDSTLHKIQKAYKAEISKLDNLPVKDLEPSIVLKTIINRLIEENSLDYARYIANLLNRFCEYCIDIGELKVNRLERLNRAIPAGKARHQPSLNSDNLEGELKELLSMIKTKPLSSQCLFFVSLLTLLRPSEIVGIQLKNIDFDNKIILIEQTKTTDGFKVPISPLLQYWLETQITVRPVDNEFLFSSKTISGHVSSDSMSKLLRENGYRDKLVSHGIRSIGRNWMAFHEDQIPFSVAQMCQTHVVGNEVTRAYFRTDLLEERRKAMNLWSEYISSL